MSRTYQHSHYRTKSGCKCCTGKSKSHREHKNIVKHNIKSTSSQWTCHYRWSCIIISCKGSYRIITHKKWCKDENDPQISFSQLNQTCICSKKRQKFIRGQNTDQYKWNTAHQTPAYWLCEVMICIFTLGFADPISCCRSYSDHRAYREHDSKHRQDQIKSRQTVRSWIKWYKKSIRKNIDGLPDHGSYTLAYVFWKSF